MNRIRTSGIIFIEEKNQGLVQVQPIRHKRMAPVNSQEFFSLCFVLCQRLKQVEFLSLCTTINTTYAYVLLFHNFASCRNAKSNGPGCLKNMSQSETAGLNRMKR